MKPLKRMRMFKTAKFVIPMLWIIMGLNMAAIADDNTIFGENNDSHITLNLSHTEQLNFIPFTLEEFINSVTGKPLEPWELVIIEGKDGLEVYKASQYLNLMNRWEHQLNEIGETLRSDSVDLIVSTIAHPDHWGRELRNQLEIESRTLVREILPPIEDCPLVKLDNLGVNVDTGIKYKTEDIVKFEQDLSVSLENLIPKLNEQQKYLCSIGYNLLADLVPGSADYFNQILAKRDALMAQLGLNRNHPVFEMVSWAQDLNFEEFNTRINDFKELIEKPSPERIYTLAKKYEDDLPRHLRLPDIPSIPAPQVEKRVDLKLLKRYEWKGIDQGRKNLAAIYAGAWAELRAGRKDEPDHAPTSDHAFQAEANGGVWLINNQINIIGATLDSQLNPQSAYADLKYCFLKVCQNKRKGATDIGIEVADPKAFYKNWRKTYSQQFVVGIVPVVLRVGGGFYSQVGYKAGLNLLSVYGGAKAQVKASALGEAAVGLKDFVEAGAGGELHVIDNTTSLDGIAEVKFIGNGHPILEGSLVGKNTIDALSGRIYAYALVDVLGPVGEFLDRIVDAIKNLPSAKDLMNKIGQTTEFGKKLYNKLTDGGKKIVNGIKSAPKKARNWVKKRLGFSVPAQTLVGTPYGLSIKGTKIRYEQDWINWKGFSKDHRFLNYKFYVGPDGKKYSGDLNSYNPEQTKILEENISLKQKEIELDSLEKAVANQEDKFFDSIQLVINGPEVQKVMEASRAIDNRVKKVISQKNELVQKTIEVLSL